MAGPAWPLSVTWVPQAGKHVAKMPTARHRERKPACHLPGASMPQSGDLKPLGNPSHSPLLPTSPEASGLIKRQRPRERFKSRERRTIWKLKMSRPVSLQSEPQD